MTKRKKPLKPEKLVDDLHKAVQAYIEGFGGTALIIGPIKIAIHKATSFDLVIEVVGKRPKGTVT